LYSIQHYSSVLLKYTQHDGAAVVMIVW